MNASPPRSVLRFPDGGWAELVGNHVALDLVNTVAWRLDPERATDRLPDGLSLVRWCHFAGVINDRQAADFSTAVTAQPGVGDAVAEEVRALRERLFHVLQPLSVAESPSRHDLEGLKYLLLDALRQAEITSPMPLRWSAPLRTVRDLPTELLLAAWRLLELEEARRLRQCGDRACGWLFLDRSKNASRVWCSSADCGNRSRARRHYARKSTPTADEA